MADHTAPPRIEWMWKSNANPFSLTESSEWCSYSDVETAIIEEAHAKQLSQVILDDYHIDLKHLFQISNNNLNNQRPVKRMVNEQEDNRLREARFISNPLVPSRPFTDYSKKGFLRATREHFHLTFNPIDDSVKRRELVERAAEGLIVEGKQMGKQREAEWMAQQLFDVKDGTRQELYACCVRLYTMESFLYKKLNEVMRLEGDTEQENVWKSKVPTFGPFALLLNRLGLEFSDKKKDITVYRGSNLSDQLIEQYRHASIDEKFRFPAFTSTSRNRTKSEEFGNVLFIMNIKGYDGHDVAPHSVYPQEEEHLLEPHFFFTIRLCKLDTEKNKWIIHLKSFNLE